MNIEEKINLNYRKDYRDDREFINNVNKSEIACVPYLKHYLKKLNKNNPNLVIISVPYGARFHNGDIAFDKEDVKKCTRADYLLIAYKNNFPIDYSLLEVETSIYEETKESKIKNYPHRGRTKKYIINFYEKANEEGIVSDLKKINKEKPNISFLHANENIRKYFIANEVMLEDMLKKGKRKEGNFSCPEILFGKTYVKYPDDVKWISIDTD